MWPYFSSCLYSRIHDQCWRSKPAVFLPEYWGEINLYFVLFQISLKYNSLLYSCKHTILKNEVSRKQTHWFSIFISWTSLLMQKDIEHCSCLKPNLKKKTLPKWHYMLHQRFFASFHVPWTFFVKHWDVDTNKKKLCTVQY